jgi:ATP synthase F1 gamma subunit
MTKKEINESLQNLGLMIGLTEAYSTISSERMKKTRESVVSSRDFLEAIQGIFSELRNSQKSEIERLGSRFGRHGNVTFLAHNGKTASVFIGANAGLYGDIITRVFSQFIMEVRSKNTEVTLVGKFALSLFLASEPNRPYTYFDYPDFGDNNENLSQITSHLVSYEEIHIFFGKFKNLAYQEPTSVTIAAQTNLDTVANEKDITKYLYEPELPEILAFFEGEMFTSTFEQALREAQLAKSASRMISMDKAAENVRQELKKVQMRNLKLSHYVAAKKQQSTFGSFGLWYG